MHRTQSTVSQQIRKLEEQMGCQLLVRGMHGALPTPDGERLLAYARRILALNRNQFAEATPELVRIGVTKDYAVESLPTLLGCFAQDFVQARLEVHCDITRRLEDMLAEERLDIALLKRLDGTLPASAESAWHDPLHWVAGAQAAALAQAPVLPLALFSDGCIYRRHAMHLLQAHGRRWRVAHACPAGVLAAVRAGLGVTVLSRSALTAGVCALPPDCGLPPLPDLQLVLQARPRLQAAGAAALQLLRNNLDQRLHGAGLMAA